MVCHYIISLPISQGEAVQLLVNTNQPVIQQQPPEVQPEHRNGDKKLI